MRTLIVDNYDSFTYNLVHLIAAAGGPAPVVVRNDDPAFALRDLAAFDNVVVSPGPGHPAVPADFGWSRAVILDGALPVLGVCLGHQGICHLAGGLVERAPLPMHGRLSEVFHDQAALFAGIPSPFQAVRYHSLIATDLPSEITVQARTADGLVMAVAHRDRPWWGVQFHPESICTQHGARLLANFADLTARWQRERGIAARPPRAPRRARAPAPEPAPAWRLDARRIAPAPPAERVFEALFAASPTAFWLDSSRVDGTPQARFSFMGDAAGPRARVLRADVAAQRVTVDAADGRRVEESGFFDWLGQDLQANRVAAPALPFDFALGWIGYLGYELKAECGGQAAHRSPDPDAAMVFADRALAFDHERGEVWLLALVPNAPEATAAGWLDATEAALAALPAHSAPEPASAPAAVLSDLALRHTRADYLRLIDRCLAFIAAGESYEICLTNSASATGAVEAWPLYRQLRKINPAPFSAFLRFGDLAVLSSSPERFLRIGVDRVVESKPIKGTRPRGASPAADRAIRAELANSEKDRAENLMIVDLVRNDLGVSAEIGSVRVDALFAIETYATVHQMVSTIRARLRPECRAVDCVRAAFPGGSMTGAPKIRTMAIIDALEGAARGVYSGALGYFSLNGAVDLSIVIRTLVACPDRVRFGVGGAIIALSDPAEEFAETAVKATPMVRLLRRDFPEADQGRLERAAS